MALHVINKQKQEVSRAQLCRPIRIQHYIRTLSNWRKNSITSIPFSVTLPPFYKWREVLHNFRFFTNLRRGWWINGCGLSTFEVLDIIPTKVTFWRFGQNPSEGKKIGILFRMRGWSNAKSLSVSFTKRKRTKEDQQRCCRHFNPNIGRKKTCYRSVFLKKTLVLLRKARNIQLSTNW